MDALKSPVTRDPALVLSLPKSGTYLVAELLKALVYRSTGMHLAEKAYTDYSEAEIQDARRDPGRFARSEPLDKSLTRIQPGEFAVGHLPFNEATREATTRFKRIYLTRDLRTALISYMRFMHSTGRLGAEQLAWYPIADSRKRLIVFLTTTAPYLLNRFYQCMAGWTELDDVLHERFEDLTAGPAKATAVIDRVAAHLGVSGYDGPTVLQTILAAETITKSGRLTRLREYWSPDAEKRFIEIGGLELNARLGSFGDGRSLDISRGSIGDKKIA